MLSLNGTEPSIVTFFTSECPDWLQDIMSYLVDFHYQLHVAHTIDDAWQLIRSESPDALLAVANQREGIAIFQAVRDSLLIHERPLLMLITDDSDAGINYLSADIIARPKPLSHLEHQLRTFIGFRSQNVSLAHENEHLRDEIETQKQSAGGINLLRNAIVRNVAHELRTPLLQVKAAVGLLAEDIGESSTLVGLAQRATTRLEAGVQNITLLNELINESFDNRAFEPVQVKEVVDSAIRNLRRSWEHKENVERIRLQLPARLPPVWGDKHRLVIALQLLIDNALKFSKDQVEVTAKRTGREVSIAIRDYGIGIPEDKIDHIYDWFYQVDNSSTRPHGGMGIGLAIVRFILDRHEAASHVETQVGKGSTFSFVLPVANLKVSK